ncbi:MAG: ATP-binding protein [Cyanobacteria bacterium P01_F01_bin.150]
MSEDRVDIKPERSPSAISPSEDNPQALLEGFKWQYQRAKLFSEVTLKIRQSLNLSEILNTTVAEIQHFLAADRVLIYQVLADSTGKAISESVLPPHVALLGMEFPEEVFPADYQNLYAEGRVQAIADVHSPESNLAECLVEFVEQFGIQAKLIVPILVGLRSVSVEPDSPPLKSRLWGLLIAHQCGGPRKWAEFELELMQQLADQIGIAIAQAELLENLETIVAIRTRELRQANQKLQQEIADRIQAENALRRNEEQLRLITDALPVLIAYVDTKQRYRFNNAAYTDWLGKSFQALQGKHLKTIWGDRIYERMRPWVKKALAGETVSYENDIHFAGQMPRSVDITYVPHQDDKTGAIKGFFALTSDISDRKAVERMKDEFISVVSHELRTPLTSIHSALKLLATGQLGKLSTDGQQMLGIADENTDRLVRLVNNVLDLQRIESGAVTMDRQMCDAAELMVKATEAMQAMARQYQIELLTTPMSIDLWVDADYIVQALTNLLSNAIKFSTPQTTVSLSVKCPRPRKRRRSKKSRTPTTVEFRVQDQGPGIPKDKLESIFERFHQVDSSDARKKGGTGLGLTICRKIIEQHDGEIWAESVEGEGSTFIFTLPIPSLTIQSR